MTSNHIDRRTLARWAAQDRRRRAWQANAPKLARLLVAAIMTAVVLIARALAR